MADDRDAGERERITRVLADWANRDPAARDELVPIVYEELRRLAHHYMRGEREGHTLQTTALVNEVYLRLAGIDAMRWRDRAHFFAMAATLMRRDRKSTRLNSSHGYISYAVFCLKKKTR